MRFGVDATLWTHRRGTGRYARNLVRRLVELDAANEYELIVAEHQMDELEGLPSAGVRPVRLRDERAIRRPLRERLRLLATVRAGSFDAVLFPMIDSAFFVGNVPNVVGIADTIDNRAPDWSWRRRLNHRLWHHKRGVVVRRAARVFTISEAVRPAVAAKFGLAIEDVPVALGAPDPVFGPRADVRPGEPFVLCLGGLSPRKNVDVMLEAHRRLLARRDGAPKLVLVGPNTSRRDDGRFESLRRRIADLGLADAVRLPGYVPDEELAELYCGASAVVIPTGEEGLGLSAMEAGASAAALIIGDIPSHRETMGDAPLYVRPGDADDLEASLGRLLADPGLQRDVRDRCRRAASRLSWDQAARTVAGLLAEAAAGRRRQA